MAVWKSTPFLKFKWFTLLLGIYVDEIIKANRYRSQRVKMSGVCVSSIQTVWCQAFIHVYKMISEPRHGKKFYLQGDFPLVANYMYSFCDMFSVPWVSGGWFNANTLFNQCKKYHCGDQTIFRASNLHNGISCTDKLVDWNWWSFQMELVHNVPTSYSILTLFNQCDWVTHICVSMLGDRCLLVAKPLSEPVREYC